MIGNFFLQIGEKSHLNLIGNWALFRPLRHSEEIPDACNPLDWVGLILALKYRESISLTEISEIFQSFSQFQIWQKLSQNLPQK